MTAACEEYAELQALLSQRAEYLKVFYERFKAHPDVECTAEIFWSANKSYNAAIIAEMKKILTEDIG